MTEDRRYFNRHKPTITLYYSWIWFDEDDGRCWFEPIEDED